MKLRKNLLLKLLALLVVPFTVAAQSESRVFAQAVGTSMARYFDPSNGLTADQAVAYALRHNGELLAFRSEVDASRALIRQAELRPNPSVDFERKDQLGGSDNTTMVAGMWPLELGGRRSARVLVAQKEVELKEQLLADRERLLAAEVRNKFGVALAEIFKLGFTEDLVVTTDRGFNLVAAKVREGRTAPLEENILLVEVNRIRSMRETNEGKVEIALFELRNIIGMRPEEPLRLKGEFDHPAEALPTLSAVIDEAIRTRPDILAARASEELASARIEQARAEGRLNASLTGKYERMDFSFPQQGVSISGQLVPIQGVFHSVAAGITLELPVRNKNQGVIAAAVAENEAAKRRREFTELAVRNEVAMAFARFQRAARAAEIYRVGVREQASSNLNVIRQTYELGSKTLLDYIAEQRRFIELENGYIDALLETYLSRVEVQRATSEPKLIALSETSLSSPGRINNREVK
ncbi:MAG TPA: TolC family protein [Pyrinomonadaceae bacterium]|nr:TolC family protein [Pyrinomonadaceae bacterium]